MDMAAVEVRDRLDRVRALLPDDFEDFRVRRHGSGDIPILRVNLSADWESARLYEFAEEAIQRRIERLDGVADVRLYGTLSRQLEINLLPARMAAHGIGVRDVVLLLQGNNVSLSGGYVREGSRKLLVRAMGELDSLEAIRELPLNSSGLVLADVASINYDFPRRDEFDFLNGEQSLTLRITKTSDANLLAAVNTVKAELAAIQELPEAEGLSFQPYFDASIDVNRGLNQLRDTGILGGSLAVLFMLVFLRPPTHDLVGRRCHPSLSRPYFCLHVPVPGDRPRRSHPQHHESDGADARRRDVGRQLDRGDRVCGSSSSGSR